MVCGFLEEGGSSIREYTGWKRLLIVLVSDFEPHSVCGVTHIGVVNVRCHTLRFSGTCVGRFGVNMKLEPSPRAKIVELFQAPDPDSIEIQPSADGDTSQGVHGSSFLSPISLSLRSDGYVQCLGYNLCSRKWLSAPIPLICLPKPRPSDESAWHIAGAGGLLCVNISRDPLKEKLVLCNPLTQKTLLLPPLNLRRNPVLIHLLVNNSTFSCKVIVAGSSRAEGSLSKCTEIFDSETWNWTKVGNVPGPEFCLNEYQNGVCIDGTLYCIAFLDDGSSKGISDRGVLAFNLEQEKWMSDLTLRLPFSTSYLETSNLQLLECDGNLYLFSERMFSQDKDPYVSVPVYHCIEKLEITALGTREWRSVLKCETERRSCISIPEYTCVPHGEGKMCIFNNIERKGVVHDTVHRVQVALPAAPARHANEYQRYSSNPLSFSFLPRSFTGRVNNQTFDWDSQGATVNNAIQYSEDAGEDIGTHLCTTDMVESVILRLSNYEDLAKMKVISKSVKGFLESEHFYRSRGNARENEGAKFTLMMFAVKEGILHCVGFDLIAKKWRRLPPFTWIQPPVNSLFSDYVVAGGGGLLCVTATDPANPGTFVVYNPLTKQRRMLPPSIFRQNPVLIHLLTNSATNSFIVIVAGSSVTSDPVLRRVTEVFDSQTGKWTCTGDTPHGFALIDSQTGVYSKGFVYCFANWLGVPGVQVKYIIAYDVKREEWLELWHPLLPYRQEASPFGPRYTIAQLVVCDDEVYLFSEIGHYWDKKNCLDKLNRDDHEFGNDTGHWTNLWKKDRPNDNDSGNLVCVPHDSGKVCIFDKNRLTGVVYDIKENPEPQISSPSEPFTPEETSFSPRSFNSLFEPSFKPKP